MSFLQVLACAVFVIVGLTQPTTAEQIGPSFDCHATQQPLAQMLCADPDLSRTDLRFAQAYFALLKQVGEAGKSQLKQEDLQFLEAVQRQCGIPASGQAAPQSEASRNCVKSAYEAQRAVWVLHLTPPFSEEANRPIERHVALQRRLQQLGYLPADAVIDGVYGAGTREAISKWQSAQGRNVTGALGDADTQALEQQAAGIQATAEASQSASSQKHETVPDKPPEQQSSNAEAATTNRLPSPQRLPEPARSSSVGTTAALPETAAATDTNKPPRATGLELNADDAKRIVNQVMNREPYYSLLLGNVIVYGAIASHLGAVPEGNNIDDKQYNNYKVWAQVGAIKITSQGPLSQQPFSANNWEALHMGIQERIVVTAACKENEICKISGNTLKIKKGSFKIEELIKHEKRTGGVHTYRILMGTYSSDWSPAYRSFCRIGNQCSLADKGKFMMLLQYDEFSNTWKAITWDFAKIDAEFTTHNVDQQIRSVQ